MKRIAIAVLFVVAIGLVVGWFIAQKNDSDFEEVKTSEFHHSFFSDKEFFDDAYNSASPVEFGTEQLGMIVPHHLVPANMIAESFLSIEKEQPKTVVLISPNHLQKGRGQIITSQYNWQTPYGVLEADLEMIEKLKVKELVSVDETPFSSEQGISDLVAFIKKSFPKTKFVPLIIKDTLALEKVSDLVNEFNKIFANDVQIIGSFDFSHYLPSNFADWHDARSLAVLEDFDYGAINTLDMDSKPGLHLVMKLVEHKGAESFYKINNTNSAKLANNLSVMETTSYLTGFFVENTEEKNKITTTLITTDEVLAERKQSYNPTGEDAVMQRYLEGFDYAATCDLKNKTEIKEIRGQKIGFVCVEDNSASNVLEVKKIAGETDTIIVLIQKKGSVNEIVDSGANVVSNGPISWVDKIEIADEALIFQAGSFENKNSLRTNFGLVLMQGKIKVYPFVLAKDTKEYNLANYEESSIILDNIATNSPISNQLKTQIKKGELEFHY